MIGMFSPKVKAGDFCPPQFHQAMPSALRTSETVHLADIVVDHVRTVNLNFDVRQLKHGSAIPIAATRFLRLNIVDNAPPTAVNLSFVIAINLLDCQWSNDLGPFWYTFFVYIR